MTCDIGDIISFLQEKKNSGFETIELVDDAKANGWFGKNHEINFLECEAYPTVLGIDVRKVMNFK